MAKQTSFRMGKVRGDLRGKVWYLTYHENGRRKRPRVGPDLKEAKQVAAQINSQLELGAPTLLGFEVLRARLQIPFWLRMASLSPALRRSASPNRSKNGLN